MSKKDYSSNTRIFIPGEKGIALLMVLWVLTILMVIVLSFSFVTRTETLATLSFKGGIEKKFSNELLNAPCYYPWYNISIFADGIVQPCFIPQEKGEQIKGKSLKEVWFSRCFSEIREGIKKGKLSKYCSKCNPWNLSKMNEIRRELRKIL